MATNQGFKSFIPDTNQLTAKYLYWWLKSHRPQLEAMGNGATFKEVSKATVSRIEIPLPPLSEQKRIAAILDQADQLRSKRRQAIALLDSLPQSIFLEMFGDPLENPKGLLFRELQELVDPKRKITYGILMPGEDMESGVPYVRVTDIKNGRILVSQLKKTTLEIANEYRRSTLQCGDVLMSIRGHVGRVALAPRECHGANITQDTARIAIVGADSEYICGLLNSSSVQHWMAQRTRGVAVRGINLGDLKQLPVALPDLAEQKAYAKRVQFVRKSQTMHEDQLSNVDSLFSSLQHRAFSGQL